MKRLCEVCSVKTSRKFAFTIPGKPIVACKDCLRKERFTFKHKLADWDLIPDTFPNECRDILNHVSTSQQLREVLYKRERAMYFIEELSKAATTVHERLLSYLDTTQMETEEIAYLKTQNCLRQEKTMLTLKKLLDDWKSFEFWKGQLSPFGQTILDDPNGFSSLLTTFILPFPSLVFESCLGPQSDPSTTISWQCFDRVMVGLNKAEQVKLSTALEEQVALESSVEDRAALSFISASLLMHFSRIQCAHIEESWKALISSAIDLPDLRENELTLIAIENSWKPAALNCISQLYSAILEIFGSSRTDVKHAIRFLNRHFPTQQIHCNVSRNEYSEEDSEAYLKWLLFFGCFTQFGFNDLCEALAKKLEETRKFEDAEVVCIQLCKRFHYISAFCKTKMRFLYNRSK